MDAETVSRIYNLSRSADSQDLTDQVTLNGTTYQYRQSATEYGRELGEIIKPPSPSALAVTTLTGFVDAFQAGFQADSYDPKLLMVHVEDYLTVSLKARGVDPWGHRATYVTAKHAPIKAFQFDSYYTDLPKFIIGLQASFLQTEELLYLIRIASNLKAGNTVQSQDDGFSQTITLKTGEVSTVEMKVKPRIRLVPLRTFPEAAPVASDFLIRFQQTAQQAPSVGLFDCEGSKWHGEQMGAIKAWLLGQLNQDIPVIA